MAKTYCAGGALGVGVLSRLMNQGADRVSRAEACSKRTGLGHDTRSSCSQWHHRSHCTMPVGSGST
eukprot:3877954-Alexandrium_andersonii.AAC.1